MGLCAESHEAKVTLCGESLTTHRAPTPGGTRSTPGRRPRDQRLRTSSGRRTVFPGPERDTTARPRPGTGDLRPCGHPGVVPIPARGGDRGSRPGWRGARRGRVRDGADERSGHGPVHPARADVVPWRGTGAPGRDAPVHRAPMPGPRAPTRAPAPPRGLRPLSVGSRRSLPALRPCTARGADGLGVAPRRRRVRGPPPPPGPGLSLQGVRTGTAHLGSAHLGSAPLSERRGRPPSPGPGRARRRAGAPGPP